MTGKEKVNNFNSSLPVMHVLGNEYHCNVVDDKMVSACMIRRELSPAQNVQHVLPCWWI